MPRTSRIRWLLLLLTGLAAVPAATAAQERPDTGETARIVEDVETRLAEAWSRGAVDEVVALFDGEATLETEWGTVFKGHEALKRWLNSALAGGAGPNTRVSRATVSNAITPEVIVTHGVTFYGFDSGVGERLFHTRVLLKTKEGWKIAAEQLARPSTLPETNVILE